MTFSCTAEKSHTEKTNRIQNQAIHMMTEAMHSTPISALETITGLQCLEDKSRIKVLTQAAKFRRLTDHPMHSQMSKPTKERPKRSSFIHHSRILGRQQPELLHRMPEPIQTHAAVPCWERQQFSTILMCNPGIERKAAQSGQGRRSMTLEHTGANYPEEGWTQVYTDGSAIESTR